MIWIEVEVDGPNTMLTAEPDVVVYTLLTFIEGLAVLDTSSTK